MVSEGTVRRRNLKVKDRNEENNQSEKKGQTEVNDDFSNALKNLEPDTNSYYLTRIVLVRYIAFIYGVAFTIAYNQNYHLIGSNGLKPANKYMNKIYQNFKGKPSIDLSLMEQFGENFKLFLNCPTFFWFFDWSRNIDDLLFYTSLTGLIISSFVFITGKSNSLIMFTLWLLYHGLVNIGQTWYSFGWESQLLESGFIMIFLVPFLSLDMIDHNSKPSFVAIILYRWLIVRIMLGAGLIKIRGDKCWKDFTCMYYFYETQPVPNPLSFYMHKEPELFHKFEVLMNHFIELVAPFLICMPYRTARIVGGFIQVKFQLILICSGNLSFLNWLTILPALACFDDKFYHVLFSKKENSSLWRLLKMKYDLGNSDSKLSIEIAKTPTRNHFRQAVDLLVLALVGYLSWPVVSNLISPNQAMNTSFEPFRIVNTYGAFGSVTKVRTEVVFKGTHNNVNWLEYEFNCKPGNVDRRPCLISPYHYRLDWLMWFAAFQSYEYNPWLISLAGKFLLNDKNFTEQMIAKNPFNESEPPMYVKADLYLYEYADNGSSSWWKRKYQSSYLPPVTLLHLKAYIEENLGWDLDSYRHLF